MVIHGQGDGQETEEAMELLHLEQGNHWLPHEGVGVAQSLRDACRGQLVCELPCAQDDAKVLDALCWWAHLARLGDVVAKLG
eukprot:SAG31_NODE_1142_length_9696_cov_3.874232_12_plen_82_part_00